MNILAKSQTPAEESISAAVGMEHHTVPTSALMETTSHTKVQAKSAFARYVHSAAGQPEKDLSSLLSNLPKVLHDLGIKTFGSEEKLQRFVQTLSGPQTFTDDGMSLNVFDMVGDKGINILRQEMTKDNYGINKVRETSGLIVDVGGNIGDFAITAAKRHPDLQVLSLEPVPTTFFILMLNLYSNDVPVIDETDLGKADKPGVLPLNKGLTSDGRDLEIAVNLNSTKDAHMDLASFAPSEEVLASVGSLSLAKYLVAHNAETVRLLKMDCEGCEFEAIPSMQGLFEDKSKVQRFSGEIHHFDGEERQPDPNNVKAMDNLLQARGCKTYGQGWWEVKC
jgi:FkbM family methyltransferase